MKAALCKTLDGPQALGVEDIAPPSPKRGEAVVRVTAVGLNFADTLITKGKYQYKPELPFAPGAEIAGTIAPPAVLNMLLQSAHLLEGIDFKRLSRIGSGAAPLSEWMVRGFAEKYGVQIIHYFASHDGADPAGNVVPVARSRSTSTFWETITVGRVGVARMGSVKVPGVL